MLTLNEKPPPPQSKIEKFKYMKQIILKTFLWVWFFEVLISVLIALLLKTFSNANLIKKFKFTLPSMKSNLDFSQLSSSKVERRWMNEWAEKKNIKAPQRIFYRYLPRQRYNNNKLRTSIRLASRISNLVTYY